MALELVTNTFLFLGYSFQDSIITSCLSDVNQCLGESANYHFTIMLNKKNAEFGFFVQDLEDRYHIKVLLINDYDELPQILIALNKEIKKKNIFFSGVFERLPEAEDRMAVTLCKEITAKLLANRYHIYTGYGRNFGNYLAGYSVQYLLTNNMDIERYLIMRPFLQTMPSAEKEAHRQMLINECPIAIFMFGQSPKGDKYINSTGMRKEFEIAKKERKFIIPIGSTGYTSKEIWKEVKDNITLYPYLERYIDSLNSSNPTIISKTVFQVMDDIMNQFYL